MPKNTNADPGTPGNLDFQGQGESLTFCGSESVFEDLIAASGNPERAFDLVVGGLKIPEVLRRAEGVLARRKQRLILDPEDAAKAGIAERDVCFLQRNTAVTNSLISEGQIKLGSGIALIGIAGAFLIDTTVIDTTINGERYVLRIETKWYGTRYYISKPLLNKISQLLAVGAGVAGLAAALQAAGIITAPSAAVTGVIAAILALGAAVLQALDFCNGIYVVVPHVGPTVPYPA